MVHVTIKTELGKVLFNYIDKAYAPSISNQIHMRDIFQLSQYEYDKNINMRETGKSSYPFNQY